MRTTHFLSALLLLTGCAAQGPGDKDALSDPSFDSGDAADGPSSQIDYRGPIVFETATAGEFSESGYAGYAFVGHAGASVSLELTSEHNDTVLYLYGPKRGDSWSDAERLAMNDDYGGTLDSYIEATLPADGTYLVLARDYWGDTGTFTLSLGCGGGDCRAACSSGCPDGSACHVIYCFRAPCPSYCAVSDEPPAPPEPRACGTRGAAECDPGEFCNLPDEALCGEADVGGVCAPIPDACPETVATPVCGCDGNTYESRCAANASSTSVAHDGECESAPPTPVDCRITGCSAGEWCSACFGGYACIPDHAHC